MTKGIAVLTGSSTQVHKFLADGTAVLSGSLSVTGLSTFTGSIQPDADNSREIGSTSNRFADVHAVQTTVGAVFESQLKTEGVCECETGTVLIWSIEGLKPSEKGYDALVIGIAKKGKDEPIVMGAEPILVTGKIKLGDWIVTSNKSGHGRAAKKGWLKNRDLTGKIIAQALESGEGESYLIKGMIGKR